MAISILVPRGSYARWSMAQYKWCCLVGKESDDDFTRGI
jgi:hypothetical protein